MKKITVLAMAFIFAAGLFAQDAELVKYVPGDVDGFGNVNIKAFAANPKFRDIIETVRDTQFTQFKDSLKSNGIDIYSAFSSCVLYFNSKSKKGGAVLKTSISESAFNTMLTSGKNTKGGKVNKTSANGKTIYFVDNEGKKTSFVYLKPDIIGISELPEDAAVLASMTERESATSNAKLMDYSVRANKSSMMWLVFDAKDNLMPHQKQGSDGNKAMNQMFPVDNIQGGFMNLNLTGQNRDNLNIVTYIICKDKSKAQLLAISIQAMVVTYVSVITQGNSQLNDALQDAIKFSNEGRDIIIKADMNSALQEQLKKQGLNVFSNPMQTQFPSGKLKKNAKPDKTATESGAGLPPPASK